MVPNLWGAVVSDPSSMQTPSTSEVFKPLTRLVLAAREKFEEEIQAYEIELIEYEAPEESSCCSSSVPPQRQANQHTSCFMDRVLRLISSICGAFCLSNVPFVRLRPIFL
ncbi:DUF3987 domain-containing protein [Spirosoma validum]|uniref:DUF3987 domain-containing protein n=1 Tax=Spirosoma validum TaxID=2771355 RepID=A0A927B668_9BACT|nr:DUF3987 domain-containing protein [Spirosoma validum]